MGENKECFNQIFSFVSFKTGSYKSCFLLLFWDGFQLLPCLHFTVKWENWTFFFFFFFLSFAQKQKTLLDMLNTNTHTHNPCKKFLLPADMVSSQTQPRHGPSTQLTEYHMLSLFLRNILMLSLRGAISLCNTWPQPPVTSPTSVIVTLVRAMQFQQRLCSASGLCSLQSPSL